MATKATPKEELQKIEKLIVRLRNKLKRADLDYTVQISVNSTDPTKVTYAAQMTPPANGLAPVTFIDTSLEGLTEKIKTATKEIDYEAVEIAYHQAQIEACQRTIQSHEERIQNIQNPPAEVDAEPEAAAVNEDLSQTEEEKNDGKA